MNAPSSLHLAGEGKGGAAGFAKGGADVTLTPSETGTLLSYDVEAKVGGKLAQLGSRIIDGFAKKMADQFFEKFGQVVEGGSAGEEGAAPAAAEAPAAAAAPEGSAEAQVEAEAQTAAEPAEKKGWLKKIFG